MDYSTGFRARARSIGERILKRSPSQPAIEQRPLPEVVVYGTPRAASPARMSWLAGLAGKAEELLNKVDQTAATALNVEAEANDKARRWAGAGATAGGADAAESGYSPYFTQTGAQGTSGPPRPDTLAPPGANMTYSVSVPNNLHKMEQPDKGASTVAPTPTPTAASRNSVAGGTHSPTRGTGRKDKDDELFEFLNSSADTVDSGKRKAALRTPASSATTTPTNGQQRAMVNGQHSRQSSGSSTNGTPSISVTSDNRIEKSDSTDTSERTATPNSNDASDDLPGNTDSSSGYHSNSEESSTHQRHVSSLELENQLLKTEVASLNQEMSAIIQRAKDAQDELIRVRKKTEQQNQQFAKKEQMIRELRSQENDLQEALRAKDSQLAVLRVRFEEASQEVEGKNKAMKQIQEERDRILRDHTSASGVQSQAIGSIKDKLNESDIALKREHDAFKRCQQEAMNRQASMEAEKQHLSQELSHLQKKMNDDKARYMELSGQLKTAKTQCELAHTELSEYKEKATRILQSKDKLITSLKEGGLGVGVDGGVSQAEYDECRQERDMFREELQRAQVTIETMRTDVSELEAQLQQDGEQAKEQAAALEEQLTAEHRLKEDAEQEVMRQKQELRYAHDDMLKQKTAFQSRINDREMEIDRLRNQLTTKSMSSSSQEELENRLHSLTESLIQKQTMLEALSTEKNSLVLQLERMERQYREAEASAQRASVTSVSINEEEDVRNRLPLFMRESPLDSDVTRRVKRAANTIDRFSMKLGVFLRRYPMARIFVIMYMGLLHVWVMVVLLTYQPEVHGHDYQPRPPAL